MSSGEKKVAALLAIVLVVMVCAYVLTGRSEQVPAGADAMPMAQGPGAAGGEAAACAPGAQPGGAATTQEYGKAGAKLEIIAVLPVAHGCHVATEAELKKAYEAHPDEVHLTVVDLFGPDAAAYKEKIGIGWTAVSINGKTEFEVNGRRAKLEQAEGRTYVPADLGPIIEAELAKG